MTHIIIHRTLSWRAERNISPSEREDGETRRSYSVLIGVPGSETYALKVHEFRARVVNGHFAIEELTAPVLQHGRSSQHQGIDDPRSKNYSLRSIAEFDKEEEIDEKIRSLAMYRANDLQQAIGLPIHNPYETKDKPVVVKITSSEGVD